MSIVSVGSLTAIVPSGKNERGARAEAGNIGSGQAAQDRRRLASDVSGAVSPFNQKQQNEMPNGIVRTEA